jgi:DNA-binding NarL/FixJ family response regulator
MTQSKGNLPVEVVVATHSREVRAALFIALNTIPSITIAATAASSSELTNYCHAFHPDIAIVEAGLPGSPLSEFLLDFEHLDAPARILIVGGDEAALLAADIDKVEVLRDVEHLAQVISQPPAREASE